MQLNISILIHSGLSNVTKNNNWKNTFRFLNSSYKIWSDRISWNILHVVCVLWDWQRIDESTDILKASLIAPTLWTSDV